MDHWNSIINTRKGRYKERIKMIQNNLHKSSVEHSPVGYLYNRIIYDDKGNPKDYEILEINKSFESMVGFQAKDLISTRISQLYQATAKDGSSWHDFQKDIFKNYKKNQFEYSFDFADKHYRVKSHRFEEDYLIMYLIDISAEVRNTEALKILSDNVPIQVWYLSDAQTYVSANQAHADFVGLEKEVLAFRDINELFSKEEAKICIVGNKKVFEKQKQIVVKSWLHNSQGQKRLLKIRKNPHFDLNGEIEFIICSAEDITEQYISEDQNKIKERILYSTIAFTQELLTNKDPYSALGNGIEMLGNATNVDRVYYWENHYDQGSKQWLTSQRLEWCLGDIEQQIDNPELQNIPFDQVGEFIETLSRNKPFSTHIKDMDEGDATKQSLEAQDILSILVLPIFVKEEFRGYVGFDSCHFEKEWSYVEISLLTSFVLLYAKSLERNYLEEQVEQVSENFNNFFNMIRDLLFVIDYEGNIIDVNRSVLKKLGYSRSELLGKSITMIHPIDQVKAAYKDMEGLISGRIKYCNLPVITKKGEIFPAETRISEGVWNGESVLFGVSKDISELSMSEEKFSKAFTDSGVSMFISKVKNGEILEVNDTFVEFSGHKKEEIIGKTTRDIQLIARYNSRDEILAEIQEKGKVKDKEIEMLGNNHAIRKGLINIVPVKINNEMCFLSSIIDITERSNYAEKMRDLLQRDGLTGVYNRRYVYDRAEEIIKVYKETKELFSVSILDLDDFKLINDTYGHHVGDYVLTEFTKIVTSKLSPQDILGRYGGEEFIVIHPYADRDKSKLILDKVLDYIRRKTFVYDGHHIKVTFSAGIAACEELSKDEVKIDKLVQLADARMYCAKKSGKNKIV